MDGSVLVAICDSRRLSFLLLASHMGRLYYMLTLSDGHDCKRRNQYVRDRWSTSRIRLISPESNRNVVKFFAKPLYWPRPFYFVMVLLGVGEIRERPVPQFTFSQTGSKMTTLWRKIPRGRGIVVVYSYLVSRPEHQRIALLATIMVKSRSF